MSEFRLIKDDWNAEIIGARKANRGRLQIICPFIKAPTLGRILKAARSDKIEVITRFDLKCFSQGVSDIEALEMLLESGARVRGVKGLHSKLYLFGDATAIATSANVTDAAFHRNHEFGFISDDPTVVKACRTYFDDLWKGAKRNLKHVQIKDWKKRLRKARRAAVPVGSEGGRLPDFGVVVGQSSPFASARQDGPRAPDESKAFIKFFGHAKNRAPRNIKIGDMVADNGANWACTYPRSIPPRQVDDGDLIYMARLVRDPNDILIFGKAIGRKHRDKEDMATKAEIKLRDWKAKWPRYVRVHDARIINGALTQGISFREMLNALGSDSFDSTQRHARDGDGNEDPFAAYNRKAHMLLTWESRTWIDERLEVALRRNGELDLSDRRYRPPS